MYKSSFSFSILPQTREVMYELIIEVNETNCTWMDKQLRSHDKHVHNCLRTTTSWLATSKSMQTTMCKSLSTILYCSYSKIQCKNYFANQTQLGFLNISMHNKMACKYL